MCSQIILTGDVAEYYRNLQQTLIQSGFSVANISKAYQVLEAIKDSKPDVVVAAEYLQDDDDIFYLSEQMAKLNIPVIFIAGNDDKQIFELAMNAGVTAYFTKKRHNQIDLIRQVQLLVQMQKAQSANYLHFSQSGIPKIGITGLTTYLQKIKNMGYNEISRKVVRYENIIWFSNDKNHLKHTNYIWFEDVKGHIYYLKESLSGIYQQLPHYFVRINDSYIINMMPDYLEGRINGSNIVVKGQRFGISRTYKNLFEKKYKTLYA